MDYVVVAYTVMALNSYGRGRLGREKLAETGVGCLHVGRQVTWPQVLYRHRRRHVHCAGMGVPTPRQPPGMAINIQAIAI